MGDYTINWLIYRDHLLPRTQRRPEQVESIELMREPFLFSHNLNCFTSRVNNFRAYHLAVKHNEFILLNVNVFGLGFQSDTEGVANRCTYS